MIIRETPNDVLRHATVRWNFGCETLIYKFRIAIRTVHVYYRVTI
jgi:hypothetical protein